MDSQIKIKYRERLKSIPPPGAGCHPYLLTVANLGTIAGIPPERIHADIRGAIPAGRRKISDKEISDTIQKAMSGRRDNVYYLIPKPKPALTDGKTVLSRIIEQAPISHEVDLREASPIRLMDAPKHDTTLFLENVYNPDDRIFIGDRYDDGILGKTIRSAKDWISFFQDGGKAGPFVIINPLTGGPAPVKGGDKMTLRGDGNISAYRYCLGEFDNIPRADQLKFWCAVRLPIVALIDSGGKSIHAWLKVVIETANDWQAEVKNKLYDQFLIPMGVDSACSNPARLSRLPGLFRAEKQAYQRLLWLSSSPRSVVNV